MRTGARPVAPVFSVEAPRCCASHCVREIVDSLHQSFTAGVDDGPPRIDQVAGAVGMSIRSLQRHLRNSGVTYSLLVDEVRRSVAVGRVLDTRVRFIEIALDLGYSNPATFARAFRRWIGICPSEFRASGSPGLTGARRGPYDVMTNSQ